MENEDETSIEAEAFATDQGQAALAAAESASWNPKAMYAVLVVLPVAAFIWIVLSGKSFPAAVGVAAASGSNVAAAQTYLHLPLFWPRLPSSSGSRGCSAFC